MNDFDWIIPLRVNLFPVTRGFFRSIGQYFYPINLLHFPKTKFPATKIAGNTTNSGQKCRSFLWHFNLIFRGDFSIYSFDPSVLPQTLVEFQLGFAVSLNEKKKITELIQIPT